MQKNRKYCGKIKGEKRVSSNSLNVQGKCLRGDLLFLPKQKEQKWWPVSQRNRKIIKENIDYIKTFIMFMQTG